MGSGKRKRNSVKSATEVTEGAAAAQTVSTANTPTKKSSKKNKSNTSRININISKESLKAGPVLGTFPGTMPPQASIFHAYNKNDRDGNPSQRIVVTETDRAEFVGTNFGSDAPPTGRFQYMIGLYNKNENKVELKLVPHLHFNSVIKALKDSQNIAENSLNRDQIREARNVLGEAFGSKKRKAKIRAEERNRIDMGKIGDAADVIGASIETRTLDMPTKAELMDEADSVRPIPAHNMQATVPKDIYDMTDILSPEDSSMLPIHGIINAKDVKERVRNLPINSSFVNKRLAVELSKTNKNRIKIRQIVYLSYLLKFRSLSEKSLNRKSMVLKSFNSPPDAILDTLYSKFTTSVAGIVDSDGNPVYRMTPFLKDKITCYIIVLMLALSDWILAPTVLAQETSIPAKKATEYLKSVGCKIEQATKDELLKMGAPVDDGKGALAKALSVGTMVAGYEGSDAWCTSTHKIIRPELPGADMPIAGVHVLRLLEVQDNLDPDVSVRQGPDNRDDAMTAISGRTRLDASG
ncbi:DNA-directed RNA polymerase I subunit rpa49 [Mycoemilia scoparia]|uniref:DNA-directed RNA polymerase I subunit rpa49 n=1 Tax=Mycoemilia scoparia TaxID=417184 RepID=A0A9W8AAF0_9FUNG|nr:DNA-directed RNA polymerase I subunit rpa49 [Mycoemilia scoparia]